MKSKLSRVFSLREGIKKGALHQTEILLDRLGFNSTSSQLTSGGFTSLKCCHQYFLKGLTIGDHLATLASRAIINVGLKKGLMLLTPL